MNENKKTFFAEIGPLVGMFGGMSSLNYALKTDYVDNWVSKVKENLEAQGVDFPLNTEYVLPGLLLVSIFLTGSFYFVGQKIGSEIDKRR